MLTDVRKKAELFNGYPSFLSRKMKHLHVEKNGSKRKVRHKFYNSLSAKELYDEI